MQAWFFAHLGWWIVALMVAGLVAGIARWRALVSARFARLASRRGGKLSSLPWYCTPRVEFRLDGTRVIVTLGKSAEEGQDQGIRTIAHIAGPGYPTFELELWRIQGQPSEGEPPDTRDPAFDAAFRWDTDDPRRARALIDGAMRRRLRAVDAKCAVSLRLGMASPLGDGLRKPGGSERRLEVSVNGVPEDVQVLEDLIDLARALHERLARAGDRRAA